MTEEQVKEARQLTTQLIQWFDLKERVRAGGLSTIASWMRENVDDNIESKVLYDGLGSFDKTYNYNVRGLVDAITELTINCEIEQEN